MDGAGNNLTVLYLILWTLSITIRPLFPKGNLLHACASHDLCLVLELHSWWCLLPAHNIVMIIVPSKPLF